MKERYVIKNFRDTTLAIIDSVNDIITDYQAQGYLLTLRQLYYQFIARDWFPEDRRWSWTGSRWAKDPNGTKNAQPNYDWLGGIINEGRMAGLIDWEVIEDRGRERKRNSHWDNPKGVIESARSSYGIDMWSNQPERVEVWIEKEALVGVIEPVCRKLDVPFFACRGYVSQSEMWRAGVEFRKPLPKYFGTATGPHIIILHLGDHDPSGIDMTRDNYDRLRMFSGDNVTVERIALNMDQIRKYNPPPSPAKTTDSRGTDYIAKFGIDSWELDALEPKVLTSLIEQNVAKHRDDTLYMEQEVQLERDLMQLDSIIYHLNKDEEDESD
ncbi:hypothetical protein LCGC14_1857180 [marine sediment metagenome]|uniref:Uncharacterized protein n=1 Tax=marine sediment metagenome TaxID=412755 RepID=A0A0F9IN14_9ZZZZ